jgi:hypothetical protein
MAYILDTFLSHAIRSIQPLLLYGNEAAGSDLIFIDLRVAGAKRRGVLLYLRKKPFENCLNCF